MRGLLEAPFTFHFCDLMDPDCLLIDKLNLSVSLGTGLESNLKEWFMIAVCKSATQLLTPEKKCLLN